MSLCALACQNSTPQSKPYKLYDELGLYLHVLKTGKKVWRIKYTFLGKEKLYTIGVYPVFGLAEARTERNKVLKLVTENIDPSAKKQEEKRLAKYKAAQTFELVALEWHKNYYDTWTERHAKNILNRLKQNVFPCFGKANIAKVNIEDALACLQKIEGRGCNDMAKRVSHIIGQVMRYATQTGRAKRNFMPDMKGALKKYKRTHYAAITHKELPDLISAINRNEKRLYRQTILGLKLIMLTFVRTNELINATWDEFNLDKKVWEIPAERMKMKRPHTVPLSRQVIEILLELKEMFGDDGFILRGVRRNKKPMSNITLLKALERLGYKGKMTGHGFRALAMSTIKQVLKYQHEVVDRQLAHEHGDQVDAAYDRATFMDDRIIMMQDWADYIDSLPIASNR